MPDENSERAARARQMYADGVTVAHILRETGLTTSALYRALRGDADNEALPLRAAVAVEGDRSEARRAVMTKRLWRTAAQQVRAVEQRMKLPQEPAERERDARLLAILVKTLRDLAAFDRGQREEKDNRESDGASQRDADLPGDLEEIRRALSQKLAGLGPGRASGAAGESDVA